MRVKTEMVAGMISVVVPMYNEEKSAGELHRRVTEVMENIKRPWELVFINDGSKDGTLAELERLAQMDAHVCVVDLRRNFGQTPALAAGFDHARGEIIIAMDGDLQHDPAEIPKFLAEIERGYDIVSGRREKRSDNFFLRRAPSWTANWLMRKMSGLEMADFGSTYKAYRRDMLDHVKLYGEMHRFIPALAAAAGAKIVEIPIHVKERPHGKSNYGLGRTVKVMMDLITIKFLLSYMTRPLHLFGMVGLITLVAGGAIDTFLVVEKLIYKTDIMGSHAPLMMLGVLLVMMGMLCIMTGLLGEVLVRTYHEATGRRIYTVRSVTREKKHLPGQIE
jgi:glycosyltransferase involved in cell wall biosynthesis